MLNPTVDNAMPCYAEASPLAQQKHKPKHCAPFPINGDSKPYTPKTSHFAPRAAPSTSQTPRTTPAQVPKIPRRALQARRRRRSCRSPSPSQRLRATAPTPRITSRVVQTTASTAMAVSLLPLIDGGPADERVILSDDCCAAEAVWC